MDGAARLVGGGAVGDVLEHGEVTAVVGYESKKRKLNEKSNGSSINLTEEEMRKILEGLSKEQFIRLLSKAASQSSAVAAEIRDCASKDLAHRKLFVGGLARETSSRVLHEAFDQYGEIEESVVVTDNDSGNSKCFGFITFAHMVSAQRALKEPRKTIDGRYVTIKLAAEGHKQRAQAQASALQWQVGSLVQSGYGRVDHTLAVYPRARRPPQPPYHG